MGLLQTEWIRAMVLVIEGRFAFGSPFANTGLANGVSWQFPKEW